MLPALPRRLLPILLVPALLLAGCSAQPTSNTTTTAATAATHAEPAPQVVGLRGDEAKSALEAAGFTVKWDAGKETVLIARNWTVTAQTTKGTVVTLAVTKRAASPVAVPSAPAFHTGQEYVDAVKQHWGDCLAALNITDEPTFTPGGAGTLQAGTVTVGGLSWNVGTSNTGNLITLPSDQETTRQLGNVGC